MQTLFNRLVDIENTVDGENEKDIDLSRCFAAFLKQKEGENEWLESRTEAARLLLSTENKDVTKETTSLRNVASILGLPEDSLKDMSSALSEVGFESFDTVIKLKKWIFDWLHDNVMHFARLLKPQGLETLFGSDFKSIEDNSEKAKFAIPLLSCSLTKWMEGEPLKDIQDSLPSTTKDKLHSTTARKFVIRQVPEFAHLFRTPLLLLQHHINYQNEEHLEPNPALIYANNCVRNGFASAEMAEFAKQKKIVTRREVHRKFEEINQYLEPATKGESVDDLQERVKTAINLNEQS